MNIEFANQPPLSHREFLTSANIKYVLVSRLPQRSSPRFAVSCITVYSRITVEYHKAGHWTRDCASDGTYHRVSAPAAIVTAVAAENERIHVLRAIFH